MGYSKFFHYIIVIPVYNESRNIITTLSKIPDYIDVVIIVDDGSIDNTKELIVDYDDNRVTLLSHEINMGKGSALRTAFRYLKKEIILFNSVVALIDGDGQMDPNFILKMCELLRKYNVPVIKGSRFLDDKSNLQKMPKFRKFGNIILKYLNRISTGYWDLTDPQSGFLLFKGKVLNVIDIENMDRGYYIENYLLHQFNRIGMKIIEYPIPSIYNIGEESSINYFSFIPRTSSYLFIDWNRRIFLSRNQSAFCFISFVSLTLLYSTLISIFFVSISLTTILIQIILLSLVLIFDFIDYHR